MSPLYVKWQDFGKTSSLTFSKMPYGYTVKCPSVVTVLNYCGQNVPINVNKLCQVCTILIAVGRCFPSYPLSQAYSISLCFQKLKENHSSEAPPFQFYLWTVKV